VISHGVLCDFSLISINHRCGRSPQKNEKKNEKIASVPIYPTTINTKFVGSVCKIESMHQLLCYASIF